MKRRTKIAASHVNHERWMVSFADFMTLLFALFVVLFAASNVDQNKYQQLVQSLEKAFGVLPSQGEGLLPAHPGTPAEVNIVPAIVPYPPPDTLNRIKQQQEKKIQEILKKSPQIAKILQVRYEERGFVLQLKDSLFFASGSAELRPQVLPALKQLAVELEQFKLPIRVEGHTDNVPVRSGFASNWDLSSSRANRVLQVLLKYSKIPPEQMSLAGYGEYRPIASNQTEEGRARNRRVDIVLLTAQAQLQEPPQTYDTTLEPDALNRELEAKLSSRRN